jgi:hypothetical protein
MEEKEILKQMAASQTLQNTASEYVVRGAMIKCSNGEKTAVLNLPEDHGAYIQGQPQINVQDSKTANIHGFGTCKMTDKKCTPELSTWLNGSNENQMFDKNTLKYESAVPFRDSYCICMRQGGIVEPINSGQVIRNPVPKKVYITDDRTAIVVNNIRFDIYNPNNEMGSDTVTIRPVEEWYTLMEYTMTEKEFSLSQALLGIHFDLEDFTREEVSTYSNQSVEYSKGNWRNEAVKNTFVDSQISSGSKAGNTVLAAELVWLSINILQKFADAVEYTHVTFYFQKANTGKHRVVLLGGTKSDYWKFMDYGFYERERSYLYDIVPENLTIKTKKEMKETVKSLIIEYLEKVEQRTSNAKLLVSKEDMQLKESEYYDLIMFISRKRECNVHHVILYPNDGNMYQKYITYPKETLAIVKRKGVYPFDKRIKLIEFIHDTDTINGNYKFWEIFDNVLKQQYSIDTIPKVSNPSNATFSFETLEDEIPKKTKPKSAFDLMTIKR